MPAKMTTVTPISITTIAIMITTLRAVAGMPMAETSVMAEAEITRRGAGAAMAVKTAVTAVTVKMEGTGITDPEKTVLTAMRALEATAVIAPRVGLQVGTDRRRSGVLNLQADLMRKLRKASASVL